VEVVVPGLSAEEGVEGTGWLEVRPHWAGGFVVVVEEVVGDREPVEVVPTD